MALKNLMVRLQSRAADTPDTPEKNMGYQRKAPIHGGCTPDTPDTPCFVDTRAIVQTGQAANDPTKVLALVTKEQAEPPPDPNAWRELAVAYQLHHFKCRTCIAAGRGAQYGLRCGTGTALWNAYQNT